MLNNRLLQFLNQNTYFVNNNLIKNLIYLILVFYPFLKLNH